MKSKIFILIITVLFFVCCFCGCTKSVSVETMQSEIENAWNSNNEYDKNSFVKSLEDSASFTVTKVETIDENCYTVTLTVTSVDILEDLKQYQSSIEQMPSNEEMNNKIKEIISSSQPKTTEQTLTVFQTENEFSVSFNEEFIDAMCGYSYTYCMNEMQSILEGAE